ncbi:hypothetical protein PtB15_1B413 [Puccinia triticina]|nr:hypothetical protein PtB15_1B413 [Puccinia triticina]
MAAISTSKPNNKFPAHLQLDDNKILQLDPDDNQSNAEDLTKQNEALTHRQTNADNKAMKSKCA